MQLSTILTLFTTILAADISAEASESSVQLGTLSNGGVTYKGEVHLPLPSSSVH
jgi:hypothetical protein